MKFFSILLATIAFFSATLAVQAHANLIEPLPISEGVKSDLRAIKKTPQTPRTSQVLKLTLYKVNADANPFAAVAESVSRQSPRARKELKLFCEANGFDNYQSCFAKFYSIGTGSTSTSIVNLLAYNKPTDYAAGHPPVRYFDLVDLMASYNGGSNALIFSINYKISRNRWQSVDFHLHQDSSTLLVLVTECPVR